MATSGVATFDPDLSEIIEESYERIGMESVSGYDVRTARRSLNILGLEWANRQVNLWTITSGTMPLLPNVATYTLPADTIDVLDTMIRTTLGGINTDLAIGRLSTGDYAAIPTKQTTGRPVQMYVNRQGPQTQITVWPVPPVSAAVNWTPSTIYASGVKVLATVAVGGFIVGQVISANAARTSGLVFDASEAANWTAAQDYTLAYWYMRRMQDAGVDGSTTMDTPARAIPALISGLAYYLAMKKAPDRLITCKQIYDEQFQMMTEEDRERTPFRVSPRVSR